MVIPDEEEYMYMLGHFASQPSFLSLFQFNIFIITLSLNTIDLTYMLIFRGTDKCAKKSVSSIIMGIFAS